MCDRMPIEVYELESEFHREAMIGRLASLAGRASFEHLGLVVAALEVWAEEDAPTEPALALVVNMEGAAD